MFRPTPDLLVAITQRQLASGLWRAEAIPDQLDQTLTRFGWTVLSLSLTPTTTKEQLLDDLGDAGDFPSHYGHNWDAAADCLTELAATAPIAILLRGAGSWAEQNERDASILAEIMIDTTAWFNAAGQAAYSVWEASSGAHPATIFELL